MAAPAKKESTQDYLLGLLGLSPSGDGYDTVANSLKMSFPGMSPALPGGPALRDWMSAPGGLPADIRSVGGYLNEHKLPIIGGTAAMAAAPFTGGSSLLGLLGLGATGAGMGELANSAVEHSGDISSYLSGQPQVAPPAPVPAPGDASGRLDLNLPAGTLMPPTSSTVSSGAPAAPSDLMNLGPVPQLPEPPQMTAPAPTDFSSVDTLLKDAAPKSTDPNENTGINNLEILAGLGKGLMEGSQHTGPGAPLGQMLLGMGTGGVEGAMAGKLRDKKSKDEDELARRKYALDMADTKMKEAMIANSDHKTISEVAYKNDVAKYDYNLKVLELSQPKILNSNPYGITYQATDPVSGNRVIRHVDTGYVDKLLQSRAAIRGIGGKDHQVDLASDKMAMGDDPVFGPWLSASAKLFENGSMEAAAEQLGIGKQLDAAGEEGAGAVSEQLQGKADPKQLMAARNRARISFMAQVLMKAAADGNQRPTGTGANQRQK